MASNFAWNESTHCPTILHVRGRSLKKGREKVTRFSRREPHGFCLRFFFRLLLLLLRSELRILILSRMDLPLTFSCEETANRICSRERASAGKKRKNRKPLLSPWHLDLRTRRIEELWALFYYIYTHDVYIYLDVRTMDRWWTDVPCSTVRWHFWPPFRFSPVHLTFRWNVVRSIPHAVSYPWPSTLSEGNNWNQQLKSTDRVWDYCYTHSACDFQAIWISCWL
jgi:hypothetical protein